MSGNRLAIVLEHIRRLVKVAPAPTSDEGLTDQVLLDRFVRNRDEGAFAELMQRHAAMVHGVCRRILSHSQDAEDAFQATFLVFARRAGKVRGSIGGWLHGVAWRVARRLQTQRARRAERSLRPDEAVQSDPAAEVTWREVQRVLDEELQRLPEKYRAPLVLCYLEGMTKDEAALRLGWPNGVLRGRLDRGRECLRARLVRRGMALSTALFGAALSESAFAGIPAAAGSEVVRNSVLFAAGHGVTPGAASAKVVALAREVTRSMIATKVRSVVLSLAIIVVLVGGASVSLLRLMANDPPAVPVAVAQGEEKPNPKQPLKQPDARDGKSDESAGDMSRARIDGHVVDEVGNPVAGAVVTTVGRRSAPKTRTAADGSFCLVLDEACAQFHTITASADNEARQGIGAFEDTGLPHVVLSQVAKMRIVVKPARKMNVRVTDAAKKPVEGAAVGVIDNSRQILVHGQTGTDGLLTLNFPADARLMQVVALKPGVGCDYYENYRSWPGSILGTPPPQVTLTLEGTRPITVAAVDVANKPVSGIDLLPWAFKKKGKIAPVVLTDAAKLKYFIVRTDGAGLATFDWLPPPWLDRIDFRQRDTEENQRDTEYSLPESPYLEPSAPQQTLVARMQRNIPISGTVTHSNGKPAAGILVQAEGQSNNYSGFRIVVRTDADGCYKMLVAPAHSYIVAVADLEWAATSRTDIDLRDDDTPRKGIDFRLDRGTFIHGKVTVGADKKPAARLTIGLIEVGKELFPTDGWPQNLRRWTEADSEGRYSFRVGPGRYKLAWMGNYPGGKEFAIEAGKSIERDIHLDRLGRAILKGVVLAEAFDGKPVAGAFVQGHRAQSTRIALGDALADDRGRFEFDRYREETLVYARNPEGTMAMITRVDAQDDAVTIVISAAGKLRGRLLDKAGNPVVGVLVGCNMHIGAEETPEFKADFKTKTDGAGRYEFPGIVAGSRCTVTAYAADKRQVCQVLPLVQAESIDLGDQTFDPQ